MSDAEWKLLFKLVSRAVERSDLAFHEKVQLLRFKALELHADVDLEAFATYIIEIREIDPGDVG